MTGQPRRHWYLAALLAALTCAAHGQDPARLGWQQIEDTGAHVAALKLQAPHPFGYVVGDRIQHRVRITVTGGARLRRRSVPIRQRIHDWLALQSVTLQASQDGPRSTYTLVLDYQTFATPLEVSAYRIPGFTLRFVDEGQTFEVQIPGWRFMQSPLLGQAPAGDDAASGEMRPDTPPAPVSAARARVLVAVSGAAALIAAAYLAWLAWSALAGIGRAPMAEARAELRRLRGTPLDGERVREGYRALHRGLNVTAGRALFGGDVAAFCREHPAFDEAAGALDAFFTDSRALFFDEASVAEPRAHWDAIDALAHELEICERHDS